MVGSGEGGGFGERGFATIFEKTFRETPNPLISNKFTKALRIGGGGSAGAKNLESSKKAFFAS